MSVEVVLSEVLPYDGLAGDILYTEVTSGTNTWLASDAEGGDGNGRCDLDLAATMLQQPHLLPNRDDVNILVLNCGGAGYAGVAALQLNHHYVTFVDSSAASLSNVWNGILLNAPDNMASVRCFSANGLHWAALNEGVSNDVW
jgi:hypothetical protein